MTLNQYETSREDGSPVELYKFIHGSASGAEYFYTNADEAITFGGDTYDPIPVERDGVKSKGRGDSETVKIEVPKASEISEMFRVFPPGRVVNVVIYQGHTTDADDQFGVVWTGRVLESSRGTISTTLTCENSEAGMKRVGLRRHYQWACPLVLYGAKCRADKASATNTGTISAVSGNTITLDAGWEGGNSTSDYLGGMVEWTSTAGAEHRTIIGVSGDSLRLNATVGDLAVDDEVDVVLGCPHTLEGCERVHDNVNNYGGQPYIPLKNPVGKNNHT